MKAKSFLPLIFALVLPPLYYLSQVFYYKVLISKTVLFQIPWIHEQFVTKGYGLDLIFSIVFSLIILPAFLKIRRMGPAPLPTARFTVRKLIYGLIAVIGMGALALLLTIVVRQVLPEPLFTFTSLFQDTGESVATAPSWGNWLLSFLAISVFGPIVEELMFRGIVFNSLRLYKPGWFSVIATALYFSLWHVSPPQIAATFVIGLVLGIVYYRTNSLWTAIILHMVNNGLTTLPPPINTGEVTFLIVAVKCVLFPVALWILWKMVKLRQPIDKE